MMFSRVGITAGAGQGTQHTAEIYEHATTAVNEFCVHVCACMCKIDCTSAILLTPHCSVRTADHQILTG